LYQPVSFRARLQDIVAAKNLMLKALDPEIKPLDAEAIFQDYCGFAERIKGFVIKAAREGKQETSWLAPNDPELSIGNCPANLRKHVVGEKAYGLHIRRMSHHPGKHDECKA